MKTPRFNLEPKTVIPFAAGIAVGGVGWYNERRRRMDADRRAEENKLDAKTGFMDYPSFIDKVVKQTAGTRRSAEVGRTHALAFMDLDNFGNLNALLSHPVTDRVALIPVASAIKANTHREGDLVSRFGGDEFVIFLSDIDGKDAHRIFHQLKDDVNDIRPNENSSEGLGATVAYTVFEQGANAAVIESMTQKLSEELESAKEVAGKNLIIQVEPVAA